MLIRFYWSRLLLILVVCTTALAVAWGAWWWLLADRLAQLVDGWAETLRATGAQVTLPTGGWYGFPGTLHINFVAPVYSRNSGEQWTAPNVSVAIAPWDPGRIMVSLLEGLTGQVSLPNSSLEPLRITAAKGDATILAWTSGNAVASANLERIFVLLPFPIQLAGGVVADQVPVADSLTISLEGIGHGWRLNVSVKDSPEARAIAKVPAPLSTMASDLRLQLLADRPLPNLHQADIARWAQSGASVKIEALDVHIGPLNADANGSVTLDSALQPEGRLLVRVTGHEAFLDAMVMAGLLRAADKASVAAGLGLLSRMLSSADVAGIAFPVAIQDRWVSIGPFRIRQLPSVDWPP